MKFLDLLGGMTNMIEDLNIKISKVKDNLKRRQELEKILKQSDDELQKQLIRRKELNNILNKKEKEIHRLESQGINKLFYSIFKRKNYNINKERQEYDVIKSKYDDCTNSINKFQRQIVLYKEEISNYYLLDSDYDTLMKEKEDLILSRHDETACKLANYLERISDLQSNVRALRAAMLSASRVQSALEKVIEYLEDARHWGVWDVMGGGLLATAAKHSKIDKAKDQVQHAQRALKDLNSKLSYLSLSSDISIEIGSFATFSDYFFDGIISDWFVQGKILNSLDKAKGTYNRINSILSAVQSRFGDLSRELDCIKEEVKLLIEGV